MLPTPADSVKRNSEKRALKQSPTSFFSARAFFLFIHMMASDPPRFACRMEEDEEDEDDGQVSDGSWMGEALIGRSSDETAASA